MGSTVMVQHRTQYSRIRRLHDVLDSTGYRFRDVAAVIVVLLICGFQASLLASNHQWRCGAVGLGGLIADEAAEIRWGRGGRAPYDRTHAEL